MRDIVDLKVIQIRLYPIDTIPLSLLAIEKNLIPFKEVLRFKSIATGDEKEDTTSLTFLNGEITYESKVYSVERLILEPLRVLLSVYGSSAVADVLYEEVRKNFLAADPDSPMAKVEPYVKVEETSCVASLDVDFRRLFSPSLLRFLDRTVGAHTSSKAVSSQVIPSRFSAKISYELVNRELKEAGVQLLNKVLTIEPRARTRLEEQRYFTLSPTDSDTHFTILREFEKSLRGPAK